MMLAANTARTEKISKASIALGLIFGDARNEVIQIGQPKTLVPMARRRTRCTDGCEVDGVRLFEAELLLVWSDRCLSNEMLKKVKIAMERPSHAPRDHSWPRPMVSVKVCDTKAENAK